MMTGNPYAEPPHTPFPDGSGPPDAESSTTASPLQSPSERAAADDASPDSITTDDINLMLATSIEKPEPDPALGSSDPTGLEINVQLTPSPDVTTKHRADERSRRRSVRVTAYPSKPTYSLPTLLLASYSSAVTLALIWVLATNRGFKTPAPIVPPPPAVDWGKPAVKTPEAASPGSEVRITRLGSPLVVGDLQVTPIAVRFQTVNLSRIVDPKASKRRKVTDCLVLTLRLMNRSSDHRLTPLELASVRDAGDASKGSFIETATGERIAMFELAMESEWSIERQSFPSVKPGQTEEVILVSEPIPDRKLASPLVWRITLQTDAGASEEIGVRFDRQEIGESTR